jgi:hypothetical protein
MVRSLSALLALPFVLGGSAAQGTGEIASGGIGLTRASWEEAHGAGERIEVVNPLYDELYAYEGGSLFVAYEDVKPGGEAEAAVLVVERAWEDDGVPFAEAKAAAAALLPADAALADPPYVAPPTPGGPVALESHRYESAALDAVPYYPTTLNPDVLVTYHERATASSTGHQRIVETAVSRVSIVTSIPEG